MATSENRSHQEWNGGDPPEYGRVETAGVQRDESDGAHQIDESNGTAELIRAGGSNDKWAECHEEATGNDRPDEEVEPEHGVGGGSDWVHREEG